MKDALASAVRATPRRRCSGRYNIIILSDRQAGPDRIPIPALLATAAVHHHLIRKGLRTAVGLVVETGEAREVHHFCCLAGYGAEAINPYLAFETLVAMKERDAGEARRQGDRQALHQVDRQGHPQGDVQDGHLDLPVVLRRADLRRGRPEERFRRRVLLRHRHAHRGRRARARSPRRPRGAIATRSATCRCCGTRSRSAASTCSASAARRMPGRPRRSRRCSTRCAATRATSTARSPRSSTSSPRSILTIRGMFRIKTRGGRRPQAGAARRGRARQGDRQALRDRRDVLRLDLARGAYHARDRHEPDRRQVEHRRGRRGSRPLQAAAERRLDALGDQAGRLGPLRRDDRIPRQLRRDADQDGAGRKARRRRAAARPQGRRHHRQGAPLDAGRRPDLAAAAPRHLFDRGPGAADLRPEEHQPGGRRLGEARLGGRRRHGRGRRLQGARRPCDDLGLRGRHRRLAAHLAQARGLAVGDRPCRNPPDAGDATGCAAASRCRSTAACAPAATS